MAIRAPDGAEARATGLRSSGALPSRPLPLTSVSSTVVQSCSGPSGYILHGSSLLIRTKGLALKILTL